MEPIMEKGEHGITKALVEFDGKPMVQQHVDLLFKLGFSDVIVGAGDHLNVKEYFLNQEIENSKLHIVNTSEQEDTGGDLIKAIRNSRNIGKNIIVENVDTLLHANLEQFIKQHINMKAIATIILTTKSNVPNEGAFFVDNNKNVIFSQEGRDNDDAIEPKEGFEFRGSSTGTIIFDTDFLRNYNWQTGDGKLSVYKNIIPELIKNGQLKAYNNEKNFFVDTGTPQKYKRIKNNEKRLFGALGNRYLNKK
jgi:NDP-sugar pyrophosphorylase family protein